MRVSRETGYLRVLGNGFHVERRVGDRIGHGTATHWHSCSPYPPGYWVATKIFMWIGMSACWQPSQEPRRARLWSFDFRSLFAALLCKR
jgi:hypothetical protein